MEKRMILFNETSGADQGRELAEKFVAYAQEHEKELSIHLLEQVGPKIDSQKIIEKAKKEQITSLIMIGGDGTINHNVEDFKEMLPNIKLGLIPGGTVNNLARVLGIPTDFEEAAAIILAGQTRGIDYGAVNEKVIISTLTIGILADTAARISQKEKQKYGKIIFIKNFIKLLARKKRYVLEIQTEDEIWRGKSQLVTITMTNSVGGFTNFDASAAPDDGLFHVSILPKLNFFKLAFYLPKVISGKIYDIPELKYLTAKKLAIKNNDGKKVGTRVDGDPSEHLPITMKVVEHGLTIFVPKDKND